MVPVILPLVIAPVNEISMTQDVVKLSQAVQYAVEIDQKKVDRRISGNNQMLLINKEKNKLT